MKTPIALTVAGSDSGGGAGIQADLKTMSALGVYGASVLTALTAQNTKEVRNIYSVDLNFITEQIETVYDDIDIDAVKIGMLGTADVTKRVAQNLMKVGAKNIVLDPVMVAKSDDRLLSSDACEALKSYLIPIADIITPNLPEASELLGVVEPKTQEEMIEVAKQLLDLGSKSVLLKGGHLKGNETHDIFYDGVDVMVLSSLRTNTKNTHGTGCTMSSALASFLAQGTSMKDAVRGAKHYIKNAVENADTLSVGNGHGPVHHFYNTWIK